MALAHLVLKESREQISGRLNTPAQGIPGAGIPTGFSDALDRLAANIAELFAAKEIDGSQLMIELARAAELGYAVTGNGYYLYLKGKIKI